LIKKLVAYFYLIIFLAISKNAYSSAWLQPQYGGFVILQAEPYFSKNSWTKSGKLESQPQYNEFTLTAYAEYGLFPWFTFIISPAFNTYSQSGNKSDFNAGYMNTTGRFKIIQTPGYILSFQVGYNQKFKSKYFGSSSTISNQSTLSEEQNYMDIRIMYGLNETLDLNNPKNQTDIGTPRTTKSNNWFVDFELAFRPYFSGGADQIRVDLWGGLKFLDQKIVLELREFNTFTLNNPSSSIEPNYDLFTIRPSIIYWASNHFAIEGGIEQDFFGTNTGMGTAPFGSLWWQF